MEIYLYIKFQSDGGLHWKSVLWIYTWNFRQMEEVYIEFQSDDDLQYLEFQADGGLHGVI